MKMKESTFTMLLSIVLVAVAYFDDSQANVIGYVMAFGFLLASSICRAIERNGKEG